LIAESSPRGRSSDLHQGFTTEIVLRQTIEGGFDVVYAECAQRPRAELWTGCRMQSRARAPVSRLPSRCPAGCAEMAGGDAHRFGLEFRIVNTEPFASSAATEGWAANFTSFPRLIERVKKEAQPAQVGPEQVSTPILIVSIDSLKDTRAPSLLDEVLAGVDHHATHLRCLDRR
jgi:hypothetical protein